jgi:intein/homing endonuclease
MMIIDEAHYLKNQKTIRYQSIMGTVVAKNERAVCYNRIQARRRIFTTGTPIVNCPSELWPLISAVDPEKWNQKTFWYFHKRYCNVQAGRYGTDFKGAASPERLEELQVILRERCMIRRMKSEVLTELPPKIRQVVELEYDENDGAVKTALAHEKEYQDKINDDEGMAEMAAQAELAKATDNDDEYKAAIERMSKANSYRFEEMARIRHETAVAKMPYAIEYLKEQLEVVPKAVVFFHHHEVGLAFQKAWPLESVLIYGEVSLEDRQAAVDRFQSDPTCRLAIVSIKAGGLGITLTAASHEYVIELPWTPGDLSQAEDRCILKDSLVFCLRSGYVNNMSMIKIQDVKIGDSVLTHEGRYKDVSDVSKHEHRGMVTRIEYVGWHEPLACTFDHKVFVKRNGIPQWLWACNVLPSDSMAFPKHAFYHTLDSVKIKDEWRIYKEAKKEAVCSINGCLNPIEARGMCRIHYREVLNKKERPIAPPQINSRYVRLPDNIKITEDWLYLFGWFVAEGFSSIASGKSKFVSFSGHEKEENVLLKISKTLLTLGIKSTIYRKKNSHGVEMRSYSGELALWFRDWFGHMAKNKTLPTEITRLCPEQAAIFLKGYTDGDGYQRGNQVEWVSASPVLCYQICELAIRAGFIPTMRRGSLKSGNHWVGGYTKFGKGSNKRLNDQDENYIYRPIRRVETKNENVMVYDLTVEEDHSFTVGFATVHNCHRIGQKDVVNVYHLVLRDSIDVKMANTIISKQKIIESALDKIADREPVLPMRDYAASHNSSRKQIFEVAAKLTQEQIEVIHEGLKYLAGNDIDWAHAVNGVGFSKIDAKIGHSLAECDYLSPKQAAIGSKLIRKYRGQIPEFYEKMSCKKDEEW